MWELGVIVGLGFLSFIMGYFNVSLKYVLLAPIAIVIAYFVRRIVFLLMLTMIIPGLRLLVVLSIIIFVLLMLTCSLFSYFLASWVRKTV